MMSETDPFIYLGPGCPTLYYPKVVLEKKEKPTQDLPCFIVPRRSIQPHAFIMPINRNTETTDEGNLDPGCEVTNEIPPKINKCKRKTDNDQTQNFKVKRPKGSRGKPLKQKQKRKNVSVQTDWILGSKDKFVFVEASQMMNQGLLATQEGQEFSWSDDVPPPCFPEVDLYFDNDMNDNLHQRTTDYNFPASTGSGNKRRRSHYYRNNQNQDGHLFADYERRNILPEISFEVNFNVADGTKSLDTNVLKAPEIELFLSQLKEPNNFGEIQMVSSKYSLLTEKEKCLQSSSYRNEESIHVEKEIDNEFSMEISSVDIADKNSGNENVSDMTKDCIFIKNVECEETSKQSNIEQKNEIVIKEEVKHSLCPFTGYVVDN